MRFQFGKKHPVGINLLVLSYQSIGTRFGWPRVRHLHASGFEPYNDQKFNPILLISLQIESMPWE